MKDGNFKKADCGHIVPGMSIFILGAKCVCRGCYMAQTNHNRLLFVNKKRSDFIMGGVL